MAIILFISKVKYVWRIRRALYGQSHAYQQLSEMWNIWAQHKETDKMFEVNHFATTDIQLKLYINYGNDKTS